MARTILIFFLISILVGSYAYGSSAMGVSPALGEFIYTGQKEISGKFTVLSGGEKNIRVKAARDLADNVTFDNGQNILEFYSTGNSVVDYSIKLPSDIKPGLHTTKIIISQFLTPEEKVQYGGFARAFAAIAYVIKLRVPDEGKFLEGSIKTNPSKIKTGDVVYFEMELLNFGTEYLENLQTEVVVRDPDDKILSRKDTNKIDLLRRAEKGKLLSFWRTEDASAGVYNAKASIEYGGKRSLDFDLDFRVGDIFIKITNTSADLSQDIGKIFVDVESNWNEEITDVYAEIKVKRDGETIDTLKSSSINLAPWGKGKLTAFWERGSLTAGDYDLEIVVYYFDKEANEYTRVSLPEIKEKSSPISDNMLLVVIIGLLVLILMVNIFWFMKGAKKDKGKKENHKIKESRKKK